MLMKLVEYECVAKDHEATLSRPNKLTVHDGRWAFCPFDSQAEGHVWRETGGADLDTLVRRDGVAISSNALTLSNEKRQIS